jgi:hypothetical protein
MQTLLYFHDKCTGHFSLSFFLNGFSTKLNHLILRLFLLKLNSNSNALSCILILYILLHSQTTVLTSPEHYQQNL